VLPTLSTACRLRVWEPAEAVRVSQDHCQGGCVSVVWSVPSRRNLTPAMWASSVVAAEIAAIPLSQLPAAGVESVRRAYAVLVRRPDG